MRWVGVLEPWLLSGFGGATTGTWRLEDGRDVVGTIEEFVTKVNEELACGETGFGEGRAVGFYAAGGSLSEKSDN